MQQYKTQGINFTVSSVSLCCRLKTPVFSFNYHCVPAEAGVIRSQEHHGKPPQQDQDGFRRPAGYKKSAITIITMIISITLLSHKQCTGQHAVVTVRYRLGQQLQAMRAIHGAKCDATTRLTKCSFSDRMTCFCLQFGMTDACSNRNKPTI